jgi:hypothetical protein
MLCPSGLLASAFYGQHSLPVDTATVVAHEVVRWLWVTQGLTDYPLKTGLSQTVPDGSIDLSLSRSYPNLWRVHEGCYSRKIWRRRHYECWLDIGYQKQEDPKGDRVVVIMNSKFCPTKVVKRTGAGAVAIYCLRSATERPFLVGVMPCFWRWPSK